MIDVFIIYCLALSIFENGPKYRLPDQTSIGLRIWYSEAYTGDGTSNILKVPIMETIYNAPSCPSHLYMENLQISHRRYGDRHIISYFSFTSVS